VNAKKQDIELQDWILPQGVKPSDVYAIGFQEIVDLNAMNVALDNTKSQQRAQFWQDLISACLLHTGISYQVVSSRVMVGLCLFIFVKEKLLNQVRDIRSAQLGVGIMGIMGNKGGVCIRLSLYDSSICFICAHLAAHRENVAGRNSDFKNIHEKTVFPAEGTYDESGRFDNSDVVRPRHGAAKSYGVDLNVQDHDFVFWLGDLNYRIDDDISIDEIFLKIKNNELAYLREKDQLNIERLKGNVFQGFFEGELNFPPTYKYQPGTDDYEARPEKKKRAPAWCDRVLWRTAIDMAGDSVTQLQYRRSNLLPSDHKPVSAAFACKLKSIISETENQVYKQLMMELELFNNVTSIPTISISERVINFGKVKYEVS
jgi:inositol polyphosphate 5-phosphatase INPP5B/F